MAGCFAVDSEIVLTPGGASPCPYRWVCFGSFDGGSLLLGAQGNELQGGRLEVVENKGARQRGRPLGARGEHATVEDRTLIKART